MFGSKSLTVKLKIKSKRSRQKKNIIPAVALLIFAVSETENAIRVGSYRDEKGHSVSQTKLESGEMEITGLTRISREDQ